LIKLQEQQFAMQTAMLEKQAAVGVAQALALGPVGGIRAAMMVGETVAFTAMARHELTKAEHFWDWKCLDQPGGGADAKSLSQLTEIKPAGDDNLNGKPASAYEFYLNQDGQRQGPVRLLVAKDSGLPARIHMDDPGGRGSVDMDYDLETSGDIEVPKCLAGH
jgi:uridine phosphorylase